jgi:hypothetical protein
MENLLSQNVIIRFALTKGDGEFPEVSELSQEEIQDIKKAMKFYLNFDTENTQAEIEEADIKECKVLYDGVSYSEELNFGINISDDSISGYPSPIIEFILTKQVDKQEFLRSVWESSFSLFPSSREDDDMDPWYFEDHNGYTSILENSDSEELIESLKKNNVYSGKVFPLEELKRMPCWKMS